MFSLSPIKILVVVAVAMILLGPDKLPEVAHKLGASWRALKRIQERVESEVRDVIPDLPSTGDLARMARSPVNLLNELADRARLREGPEEPTGAAPGADAPDEAPDTTDAAEESSLLEPPPLFHSSYRIPPAPRDPPSSPDPSLN